MKTIYKYPFEITDEQAIDLPIGFQLLHVGVDPHKQTCLWCLVDPAAEKKTENLFIVGTGNPVPDVPLRRLGSFLAGPYVWHVFLGL